MKKRILAMMAVGVMAVGLLAGCGSSGDSADTDTADSATEDVSAAKEAVEEAAEAASGESFTIGYSTPSLSIEFCANMEGAISEACEEKGYELVEMDCDLDGATQVSQCEDLINQGVDAIVLFPIAPDACASIGTECEDAGIPLIVLESEIETYTAAVLTDMYAVGEAQAEKAIELVGDDIKPVILQGPTSQTTMISLKDGAVDTFEAAGIEVVDIQVGDNMIDTSQQKVENWISNNTDFNCIITSSDGSASGAINALRDAGMLDDVVVVSENGDTIGLELIQAGELECTVNLPSKRYGYEGMDVVEAILTGQDYEEISYLSIDWIDSSNVADYIE